MQLEAEDWRDSEYFQVLWDFEESNFPHGWNLGIVDGNITDSLQSNFDDWIVWISGHRGLKVKPTIWKRVGRILGKYVGPTAPV